MGLEERIASELGERGWCALREFVDARGSAALAADLRAAHARGELRPAGIGRGAGTRFDSQVRGGLLAWIDLERATPAQRAYLERLERLRSALNERLFLGLFDIEAQLALYPPGAGYARHLDRFQGSGERTLSTTLYLNEGWSAEQGGALRIHLEEERGPGHVDVLPEAGTLALFLSERFAHEVLPAQRERLSITAWLRRRA